MTLHLDTELSYSDGDARTFRSFVFGSPLSVQQPANLAKVILVDKFKPEHWKFSGPVMLPIRVDTAWQQESEPHVHVFIALPPNRRHEIGDIKVQLIDPRGELIAEYDADQEEVIHDKGNFARRSATWRQSVAAPGSYHVQAIVYDANGQELARVAPRLVSVNMDPGY